MKIEKDISIKEMKEMQKELFKLHKEEWGDDMYPEAAKNHLLYMIEEIGESIAIIKKKGIEAIMEDEVIRKEFITEMTDVARYYVEVLNRLEITAEEYTQCYKNKHKECIKRNYEEKWKKD